VLQEVPRKIDIPARYGGEEFAVLLDNVDVVQAKAVAERIRIRISRSSSRPTRALSVTESIGVPHFPTMAVIGRRSSDAPTSRSITQNTRVKSGRDLDEAAGRQESQGELTAEFCADRRPLARFTP
jgi:GGDEF domain-containing protein